MLYWGLPQTSYRKEAEKNYDGHLGNNDTLRAILQESEANLEMKIFNPSLFFCVEVGYLGR